MFGPSLQQHSRERNISEQCLSAVRGSPGIYLLEWSEEEEVLWLLDKSSSVNLQRDALSKKVFAI